MSKKPKDKAIEKIANFINERPLNDTSHECAEAIIDALGLEFVDGDSNLEVGDLVQYNWQATFSNESTDNEIHRLIKRPDGKLILGNSFAVTCEIHNLIQRNGKPVINVDELGEKENE